MRRLLSRGFQWYQALGHNWNVARNLNLQVVFGGVKETRQQKGEVAHAIQSDRGGSPVHWFAAVQLQWEHSWHHQLWDQMEAGLMADDAFQAAMLMRYGLVSTHRRKAPNQPQISMDGTKYSRLPNLAGLQQVRML